MTPERWSEVERVCHAALAHDPPERAALIAAACAGDAALRREVESLLAHEERAADFMSTPALDSWMLSSTASFVVGRWVDAFRRRSGGRHGRGVPSVRHETESRSRRQGLPELFAPILPPGAVQARSTAACQAQSPNIPRYTPRRVSLAGPGHAVAPMLVLELVDGPRWQTASQPVDFSEEA